jgi:uncharacterized oxidoreductase
MTFFYGLTTLPKRMKLTGNKIIITGASDGIGKALAIALASRNNTVIAVGRNGDKLRTLADTAPQIIPHRCDLADPSQLQRLATYITENHPDTNLLINNAGVQFNYDFSSERDAFTMIASEIQINLTSPLQLIALLLPILRSNRNGAIINISSGVGLVPKKQAPVYSATKAGLHLFTMALRYQLKDVRVVEVIPPLVETRMTEGRRSGKISTGQFTDLLLSALERDISEINIGKIKLLRIINRLSPRLAARLMNREA